MNRTLYWKRLLIVAAAAVVFGGVVLAVHRVQFRSQVTVYKENAERVAAGIDGDKGKRAEALELYARYLKFRPADEAAFQKYAGLLFDQLRDEPETAPKVAAGVEKFLRAFPAHPTERRKLAELYVKNGEMLSARQHAEMLLGAPSGEHKGDIELLEMAAQCEQGLGNLPKAVEHLGAAIATGKAPVRVYKKALELNHSNANDPQRNAAVAALLDALLNGPRFRDDLKARVAAVQFQLFLKEIKSARDNIDAALATIPGAAEDPDALLAAAQVTIEEAVTSKDLAPKLEAARKHLARAHELDPKHTRVGDLLSEVLARQGKREEALRVLRTTAKHVHPADWDHALIADRFLDLAGRADAAELIGAMAEEPTRKPLLPYFRGRLAALDQDWPAAQRLLAEGAPAVARAPLFYKKAMVGLAACAEQRQNPDKQLDYCRLAMAADPGYPPALVGEAEALVKMGQVPEALKRYRRLVSEYQLLDYRPTLVELELVDALRLPPEQRTWDRFDEALGPPADRPAEVRILAATGLALRGKRNEGAKDLRAWLDANPKHPKAGAVFVALSRLDGAGTADAALKVLDDGAKALGDTVELRLARVPLLASQNRPPAAFAALTDGADKFPPEGRFKLLFEVGRAAGALADVQPGTDDGRAARDGFRALALANLRAAAALMPKDLVCRVALLDQGIAAGDRAAVDAALKEIAAVEGENGPFGGLGRISIRLPELQKRRDELARDAGLSDSARAVREAELAAEFKKLRDLAALVREARPGWGRVYVALAELDRLEGRNDAALAHYVEAIDKGETQEYVLRQAVNLYRDPSRNQDAAAVELLNRQAAKMRLPDDLERYRAVQEMITAAELPRNSRAKIDEIAPAASKDYRTQLLRGALLATVRDDAAAETAYREATRLNGRVPETWAALVGQFVRANKTADAKAAVAQAEQALAGAAPEGAEAKAELRIAVAGLREMAGDPKGAEAALKEAVGLSPTALDPTRQLIQFYQRSGQLQAAVDLMSKAAAAPAPDLARWARRRYALTLISGSNGYAVRSKALELIEQNLGGGAGRDPAARRAESEDIKARAVVWTVDPVTREQGMKVLKEFGDRNDLTPDESFLLGRLYFDQGLLPLAVDWFQRAARLRPGVTVEHMAALVRVHLATSKMYRSEGKLDSAGAALDKARGALERLKSQHPNSWEAVREEARLLHARSQLLVGAERRDGEKLIAEAKGLVQKFPGWDAGEALVTRSGPLFEELGLNDAAEAAYKKFAAESADAGAHQSLGRLYIRGKEPQKAIDLAFEREAKAPVLLTATLLTGAVRAKRPDPAVEARVEKWLTAAQEKAATDPELTAALIGTRAELHDARGEFDAAIREYERAVAAFDRLPSPKGRKDIVVNNLCMLIALHQPKRADEAVRRMSEVIAIRGPVPSFLDTRAVAYLVSSRPDEAVKDLQMALIQFERAAYRFHLGWAYDLNVLEAKRVLAVDELTQAKRLGLSADDLHPIEFAKYKALLDKYKIPLE